MIAVLVLGVLIIIGAVLIASASLLRAVGPLVALAVGIVVVLLAAITIAAVGFGGGEEHPTTTGPTTRTTTKAAAETTAPPTSPRTVVARDATNRYEVSVQATMTDAYEATPPVIDRLPPSAVLRIRVGRFDPDVTGFLEQCSVGGCANQFPVAFSLGGNAYVQYLVDDAFATHFEPPSTCRAGEPPCVVRVRSNNTAAYLTTVFRDRAPAPRRMTVESSAHGLLNSSPVRVAVTGFHPGEQVRATLCAAPHTHDATRCGAPGPVSPFTIGADGTGRTTLVVRIGRVGSAGDTCGRSTNCAVVVSDAEFFVPGPAVRIAFAGGPATRYDRARWLTGLTLAAAFLLIALLLARTTDWRKPTEADTPDLDRAVLPDET